MSKASRDRRALQRRQERYLYDREKPEDLEIDLYNWNRARIRNFKKWERQQGQLLFQDGLAYLNWLHFGKNPLA